MISGRIKELNTALNKIHIIYKYQIILKKRNISGKIVINGWSMDN